MADAHVIQSQHTLHVQENLSTFTTFIRSLTLAYHLRGTRARTRTGALRT